MALAFSTLTILCWSAAIRAPAQTMPGQVYHALLEQGQENLARDLSRRLDLGSHPSRREVEDFLDRWEKDAGGPETGFDWLAVARLWVRAEEADRAASALRRGEGRIPSAAYLFERARIRFLERDPGGTVDYWNACEVADETAAIEAWLDVEPLATPAELQEWDRFRTIPAADRDDCAFLRRFWHRRAALAGVEVDARIVQHYRRLRYALARYRRRGRVQPSFTVRLGRPANAMFDDRGLLYVRMGEPDQEVAHAGDICMQPNVSWVYNRPEGHLLYHLSAFGGTDDWYLIENLALAYRCGAWDRSPAVAVAPLLIDIPGTAMYDLYMSRAGVDPAYARIAHQAAPGGRANARDDLARMRVAEQLTEERQWTWEAGEYAVASIPERPPVELGLDFGLEWLNFRSSRPGLSRVWLNGFARARDLVARESDGRTVFELEAAWTLIDEQGDFFQLIPASFQVSAPARPDRDAGLSFRLAAELEPGDYRWMLVVTDAGSRLADGERPVGGYAVGNLSVRDMSADLPVLSDVAVSSDSVGTWSPSPGISLNPSPAHVTGDDGVAFIYYEVYNLTPGGHYETRVRLDPVDGGQDFDLSYPGTAPGGARVATRGYLRIDLSATIPGRYRMTVTVRDLTSGILTLPVRTEIRVDRVDR